MKKSDLADEPGPVEPALAVSWSENGDEPMEASCRGVSSRTSKAISEPGLPVGMVPVPAKPVLKRIRRPEEVL